jgi:enamine deaminase RidA (YjgF/YER057c/UK114 family)
MSMPAIRAITSPSVAEPPPGLFSNCLVVGDTIHVSGQHAGTPDGAVGGSSMLEQAREALRRVLALIQAAGGTADDVVKLTVYICDMARRTDISTARREVFAEPLPCSTLIGVNALVSPDLLVEIDAIAILGSGGRQVADRRHGRT